MNATLTSLDPSLLAFDFVSWGNAYYLQSDCPGYPDYDRSDGVACWQSKCVVDSHPSDCFTTEIACQHGDDECTGNLIETCVKHLATDALSYMSFAYCYEGSYPPSDDDVAACAAVAGLTMNDIEVCTGDADLVSQLQQTEAYKTAQAAIPGTPTIIMNGESITTTRLNSLLKQVCGSFIELNPDAEIPEGCSKRSSLRGGPAEAIN